MNTSKNVQYSSAFKFLVITASFVIIVAGMKAAQTILVPFLLSVFIAVICGPLLFWLNRKKIPMGLALVIVIVVILCIGLLFGALVSASIIDFSNSLPVYEEKLGEKTEAIKGLLDRLDMPYPDRLMDIIDIGAVMRLAQRMLTGLGNLLGNAFLILLTVSFILLEAATFPVKIDKAFGKSEAVMDDFRGVIESINSYMVIKTYISLTTGILVTVWLTVLKVDFPILWGLLAFIFNYVPNIGSIIAAIPAVLLAYVQTGITTALLAAGGYLVLNVVIGSVIEPRFMGRGLGLSTLVVFLSLVFWGWILGPVGMVLSIPLTMTIKIALSNSDETSWISTLLGSK
jgi:AI-2 transport protein TqsA